MIQVSTNQIRTELEKCDALQGASQESLDRLERSSSQKLFRKGQPIYAEGAESKSVYLLVEGLVAFKMFDESGREFALGLLEPSNLFGQLEIFSPGPRISQASAHEDCRVLIISKEVFESVVMQDSRILMGMVRVYAFALRRLLRYSLFRDVEKQLAFILLDLGRRFGNQCRVPSVEGMQREGGGVMSGLVDAVEIDVHLPQEFLASMVGVPRQRINILLKSWEACNWIQLRYSRITLLDRPAMKEFSRL